MLILIKGFFKTLRKVLKFAIQFITILKFCIKVLIDKVILPQLAPHQSKPGYGPGFLWLLRI